MVKLAKKMKKFPALSRRFRGRHRLIREVRQQVFSCLRQSGDGVVARCLVAGNAWRVSSRAAGLYVYAEIDGQGKMWWKM